MSKSSSKQTVDNPDFNISCPFCESFRLVKISTYGYTMKCLDCKRHSFVAVDIYPMPKEEEIKELGIDRAILKARKEAKDHPPHYKEEVEEYVRKGIKKQ